MIVYLNDRRVLLHRGMKVKHALSSDQLREVRAGKKEVRDRKGNRVGLEGALVEGTRLYINRGEPDANVADSP